MSVKYENGASIDEVTGEITAGHITEYDAEAFTQLYRENYDSRVRAVTALVRNKSDAEEIVQEALLGFWANRGNIRGDPLAYIMRSATNGAVSWLRRKEVKKQLGTAVSGLDISELIYEPAKDPGPERIAIGRAVVHDIVTSLSPRQREVVLFALDGSNRTEMAEEMGISPHGVTRLSTRARTVIEQHPAAQMLRAV